MPYDQNCAIADLSGIATARMKLVAPVTNVKDLETRMKGLSGTEKFTLYGRRGSQGGQCLLDGAVALDLDLLQSVTVHESADAAGHPVAYARVGAGAQWNHLHQALAHGRAVNPTNQLISKPERRWAPTVHQSSPDFTVGGSLAVNCHGRDPRQPPVAGTVRTLDVLAGNGTLHTGLAPSHELARAVLGGYGACGIILAAELALKPERQLRHRVAVKSLKDHLSTLENRMRYPGLWPHLHYAFLAFDRGNHLFSEVIAVDGVDAGEADDHEPLRNETFLSDDGATLLFNELRQRPDHPAFWALLIRQQLDLNDRTTRTLNAMRAPVRFSQMMGVQTADFLQEYFLPVGEVDSFLNAARKVFNEPAQVPNAVKLLSATLRVVQQSDVSLLSYSADGPRISVVFNMNAPMADLRHGPHQVADSKISGWTGQLIEEALARGGSFYLPYTRCATQDQFRKAYPGWENLAALRHQYDQDFRLDNQFLNAYQIA